LAEFYNFFSILKSRQYIIIIEKNVKTYNANKLFAFGSKSNNMHYIEQAIKRNASNLGLTHNKFIQTAAENGNTELVKLLLKSSYVNPGDTTTDGIRYNRDESDYAIRRAASKGHLEVVKLLLKHKRVNPTAINKYALRHAAKNGHAEVVKLLLKDKKVVNSLTSQELIKILKLAK